MFETYIRLMKQNCFLVFCFVKKRMKNGETMNNFLLSISRLLAVNLEAVSSKVNDIMKMYVGPVLSALGSCAVVFMVVLGVQYAKSESAEKKEELKKKLINALIGMLLIIGFAVLSFTVDWAFLVNIFGYAGNTHWENGSWQSGNGLIINSLLK